jgi:hypothetical protein
MMLKRAVRDGIAICYITGAALREIKEKNFWRAEYETWQEFIETEYGWTHRYVNQLIVDADAINSLPAGLRKFITSHQAAKALASIPENLRAAVVEDVTKGGSKPAKAKEIKKLSPPPPKPKKTSPPPPKSGKKSSPPAPKPKAPKEPTDETGLVIPEEIRDLWNKAENPEEVRGLLVWLRAIENKCFIAKRDQDLIYAEVNLDDVSAKASSAISELKLALPYAVCPSCQGKLPKDCLLCKGKGFLSKFRWDTAVSEEIKAIRIKK